MTKPRPAEFKWRQFEPQVILMAVGWYLRFSLSYRDVEELVRERGISVDHVTVWRWVQRYAPEIERRLRPHLKPTNKSWRVDETYIRVKGKWTYLYRAVDSTGASIDFLMSARRDAAAAKRFFQKALSSPNHPTPRVINVDKNPSYPPVIEELKSDGTLRRRCHLRPVQYLNNILEQDHRAIKRRVRASQGFRSFWGAWRTIQGYEAMHAIRKGQARRIGVGQVVVVPFLMGWGILILWGSPSNEAIFVGASMVATSVGITAQVLSAKGLLHAVSSKIILAAAVIDDVLGLLVLAVVSSLTHGKLNILELALTAALAVAFTVIVAKWGTHAMGRVVPHVDKNLRVGEAQFALAMSLLFALSLAAVYIGVAAIVGAFLAGLALAESTGTRVRDLAHGVTELLVPFFLAGIGLHVSLSAFSSPHNALLAVVILVAAVVSKFVGCGLGALGLGKADALRIGVGMIPRGEVGMVVAQIGLGFGIISQNVYGVVVFMSVATTIVAPPLIKVTFRSLMNTKQAEEPEEAFRLG